MSRITLIQYLDIQHLYYIETGYQLMQIENILIFDTFH